VAEGMKRMNNELGAVGVLQIMKGLIVILGGGNFIPEPWDHEVS